MAFGLSFYTRLFVCIGCIDTAEALIIAYPWYFLLSTIHKITIHGTAVIDHALLSIGEFEEEAAESNNKEIKKCRLQHSR